MEENKPHNDKSGGKHKHFNKNRNKNRPHSNHNDKNTDNQDPSTETNEEFSESINEITPIAEKENPTPKKVIVLPSKLVENKLVDKDDKTANQQKENNQDKKANPKQKQNNPPKPNKQNDRPKSQMSIPGDSRPDYDPNEKWAVANTDNEPKPEEIAEDTTDNNENNEVIDIGNLVRIGITIGDLNGVGIEVILKTFTDPRVAKLCVPIVYGSAKALAHHRKALNINQIGYNIIEQTNRARPGTLNVLNCWDEDVTIDLGQSNKKMGHYAFKALEIATQDLLKGKIDALVTAPVNKNLVNNDDAPFKGHTEYLTEQSKATESVMLLVSDKLKVGLVTNHIPIKDVARNITPAAIVQKLRIMDHSLRKDFGILRPRIAVLALNPHAGDDGLIGIEEQATISPAIEHARRQENMLVFGPFPADGFFGSHLYAEFDAVLAMYHDQGLVPFKALSFGHGVNFTAGLPIVRTSPDHGTAYDIAGKGIASEESFRTAIFMAIDVLKNRQLYNELRSNPLRKLSNNVRELATAEDEAIED